MSLYHTYYEKIKKYTSILCKHQEGYAEDMVQDIFTKLWERRDKLHLIDSPENYLSIMTKNQFLMAERSLKRKTKSLTQFHSQEVLSSDLIEQDVLYRESKWVIDNGIKKLPSRMKMAITLKQEGYKIKEIALLMQVHHFTAKKHVIKARNKLKVFLN